MGICSGILAEGALYPYGGGSDPERLQREVRWYLEDSLPFPYDPAPQMAARVEGEMAELGRSLFRALFQLR